MANFTIPTQLEHVQQIHRLFNHSERRRFGILSTDRASGPDGLARENHRRLTNIGDANLSPCAANADSCFLKGSRQSGHLCCSVTGLLRSEDLFRLPIFERAHGEFDDGDAA